MKILLFVILFALSVSGIPVDQEPIPFAEPEELDRLLAEKRYEEFTYLMDLGDPELAKPDELNVTLNGPMLNAKLHEGDILLGAKAREEARQGLNLDKYRGSRWPNGQIFYTISNDFDGNQRNVIQRSIDRFNREVRCVKFIPRNNQRDYVHIFSGRGCYARLGRGGNQQPLSLDKNGCVHESVAIHEMDHAVGFSHEQNRSDRDDFVRVLWDNIPEEWRSQYNKNNPDDYGLQQTYDYYSIMHYGMIAPGTNKKAFQILRGGIDENRVGRGRNNGFTDTDIRKINQLYAC